MALCGFPSDSVEFRQIPARPCFIFRTHRPYIPSIQCQELRSRRNVWYLAKIEARRENAKSAKLRIRWRNASLWCCLGAHQVPLGSAVVRCAHVPVVHFQHSCIPRPSNTRSFETAATLGIGRRGDGSTSTQSGYNPREADLMGLTASGWCSWVGRCLASDSAFVVRPNSAPVHIPRVSKPSGTLGIRRRGRNQKTRGTKVRKPNQKWNQDVLPPVGVPWILVRFRMGRQFPRRPIVPPRYHLRCAVGVFRTSSQKYEVICRIKFLARYY